MTWTLPVRFGKSNKFRRLSVPDTVKGSLLEFISYTLD